MSSTEHIWSYGNVEQLFMHYNQDKVRDIKNVYRVHFRPKHGCILIERKNGAGYLFSATSEKTSEKTYVYTCVTKPLTSDEFKKEFDKIGSLRSHKKQVQ